jgi:hypothetical protein
MSKRIDLFDSTYSNFTEQVLAAIRAETFDRDIGQRTTPFQNRVSRRETRHPGTPKAFTH